MKGSRVSDCRLMELPKIHSLAGNITSINNGQEIPFTIQRVYYLYDVPGGEARGAHAHRVLQQLIVAGSGGFDIILQDGLDKITIHLARPYQGLYVPSGLWRELDNFSSGAICLVMASTLYAEEDYIRSFQDFVQYKEIGQ